MINASGEVAFVGDVAVGPFPDVDVAEGVFLYSHGSTIPVVQPGDTMPGRDIVISAPATNFTNNYWLNDAHEVTFTAALSNNETGIYRWSDGDIKLIAKTGTVIDGVGIVDSINGGGMLNNHGQVLFWVTTTTGDSVLLIATPGH